MSASNFSPRALGNSYLSAASKNQAKCTIIKTPTRTSLQKVPFHSRQSQNSKDHPEDSEGLADSSNKQITSNSLAEGNKKLGEEDIHESAIRSFTRNLATSSSANEAIVQSTKKEAIRAEEFRYEREIAAHHARDLHNAVVDLNDFSNTINRRLDDTYYSILEKLSSLQSTMKSVKEVTATTRQLNVRSMSECRSIADESNKQLDSFDNFIEQNNRILHLKKRIDDGRQDFLFLGEKLEHVRKRVENLQKSEHEWRNATRKGHKIFWGMLGGVLVLTLLIYVSSWWLATKSDEEVMKNTHIFKNGRSSFEEIRPVKQTCPRLQLNSEIELKPMKQEYKEL